MITIEMASEDTEAEMIGFLKKHEDYSLFLLGNHEAYGNRITEAPYSGNFKLIRRSNNLRGVFCLTRSGSLMVQSEIQEPVFELILKSCREEAIPITGVIGEWSFCSLFWEFLKTKGIIQQEVFVSREILYTLNVSEASFSKDERVRLLNKEDFFQWQYRHHEYIEEEKLPKQMNEEQLKNQFLWKVDQKIIWGLFVQDKLTTIAELNAKALDLGQVGGVYTSPPFRKQGLATALMRQLSLDAKNLHGIRKLIIFTGENNAPARTVYESLGVNKKGYFALLFGY